MLKKKEQLKSRVDKGKRKGLCMLPRLPNLPSLASFFLPRQLQRKIARNEANATFCFSYKNVALILYNLIF